VGLEKSFVLYCSKLGGKNKNKIKKQRNGDFLRCHKGTCLIKLPLDGRGLCPVFRPNKGGLEWIRGLLP